MEIISRNTYYKIEDDILTIAFADSEKPNPDNYLILQREVDDLEYYYYEINSQQYSGVGGFKKVEIYSDKLVIYFQENQKIYQNSIKNLIITYQPEKKLNEYIEYIGGIEDLVYLKEIKDNRIYFYTDIYKSTEKNLTLY